MSLLLLFRSAAAAPATGAERKRRSTARKRKPGVVAFDGTPLPAAQPPIAAPTVGITLRAREGGSDKAAARVETRFLPVVAVIAAQEDADRATGAVKVTGLGFDEDDLEILAILMRDY